MKEIQKEIQKEQCYVEIAKSDQVVAAPCPRQKLKDLDLTKGKEIEVQGRLAKVSDQKLLVANKITAIGQTVEVQRMGRQRQQTGMQQQSQTGMQQQQGGSASQSNNWFA